MTELSSTFELLTGFGGDCVTVVTVGTAVGLLFGAMTGAVLGWFAARPMLRWGLGEEQLVGCLATGVMVVAGGIGGLWVGSWCGSAVCAQHAIGDNYLLEDLTLNALITVAIGGDPSGDPVSDGRRIREAVDEAGGSLRLLLEEVKHEVLHEAPGTELPAFLSPEIVSEVMAEIERDELFQPEAMAEIVAGGGLAQAVQGSDAELAVYAQKVVDTSEPMRREVLAAIHAAVIFNAVVTPLIAIGAPFLLMFLVAGVSRLVRGPGCGPRKNLQRPVSPGGPPVRRRP